jgi:hypothetical protein
MREFAMTYRIKNAHPVLAHRSGRRFLSWALATVLPMASLGVDACEGSLSSHTINPNGSYCAYTCECNNFSYEGRCVAGKCKSVRRESCSKAGAVRLCIEPVSQCQGVQICKPAYLPDGKWGDCDCGN